MQGKISAPIPFQDDDEFPIRTPGTGIATPLGSDGTEARLRASLAAEIDNKALQTGIPISNTENPNLSIHPAAAPTQPVPETQTRRTNQPTELRDSGTSIPSASSIGKPQRKKSSFRSALSRLFGKKSKNGGLAGAQEPGASGARAGQHRSVSLLSFCIESHELTLSGSYCFESNPNRRRRVSKAFSFFADQRIQPSFTISLDRDRGISQC